MAYSYIFGQIRPLILFIYDYNCAACNSSNKELQVDHIDGNSRNDCPFNLQPLCRTCHDLKSNQKGLRFKPLDALLRLHLSTVKSWYKL